MAETIVGLKDLEKKLKRLEKPDRAVKRGLRNYYLDIQKDIENYPPATSANRPPAPYYVRGTGTFTGRKNRGNSEKMSNKWARTIKSVIRGVELTIKNTASYSPFVVGKRQARFHKLRGWPQTHRLIEITKAKAVREIKKEIDRELER